MRAIESEEAQREASGGTRIYGHIPLMAECHLGERMASSFCERVNSAAKLLLGERRACLSDEELQMTCDMPLACEQKVHDAHVQAPL